MPTCGTSALSSTPPRSSWKEWAAVIGDCPGTNSPSSGAIPNLPQYTGKLAESWEQPDATTIVLNIRKGVKWHDKEPVNGRELVADDVVFNFNRNLGLGEFAADGPSPVISVLGTLPVESITATDSHTVVFTLQEPMLAALYHIVGDIYGNQYPPEVIRQDGDAKDWNKLIGTGPFMFTERVADVSFTYTKHPDYWGFDEKFPDNRLPYADEFPGPDHAGRIRRAWRRCGRASSTCSVVPPRLRCHPAPRPRGWREPTRSSNSIRIRIAARIPPPST